MQHIKRHIARNRIQTILLAILSILFMAFTVMTKAGLEAGTDLVAGCILSVTSAFLGYVIYERAFRFDSNIFLIVSMAGMTLRFFMLIASVAAFIITTTVNVGAFVGSFMVFYTFFMVLEIIYINRKTDLLKVQSVRVG